MDKSNQTSVILFDGVCVLCSGFVQWVIARDKHQRFRFAQLQSEVGRALCEEHQISEHQSLGSMVLVMDGKAYKRSTAALKILKHLKAPWPIFYGLIIIPSAIRDWVYRFIAKRRYRWFGQHDQCYSPDKHQKDLFL